MRGPPFAKGKSEIHVAQHIKLGALGKKGLQASSSAGWWVMAWIGSSSCSSPLHGGKELTRGPGSLLHAFQTLRKALVGKLLSGNQADSFTILWSLLFPAKNENGNL